VHTTIQSFLENMAVIIASIYLLTKIREYLLRKHRIAFLKVTIPLLFSLLSLLVMLHPFMIDGLLLDLRMVPLFMIGYLGGWKGALLAIILPTLYRYNIGGSAVVFGIILNIFLPAISGVIFHARKKSTPASNLININDLLAGYLTFDILKSIIVYLLFDIPLHFLLTLTGFASISMLAIALIINDSTRSEQQIKELEYRSRYDFLTKLPNVRFFKEKVNEYIKNEESITIAMLDIDFFKQYNDTHGHPTGDMVLKTVGQLLQSTSRKKDMVARYGGEEFIICIRDEPDSETIIELFERLRKVIEAYKFLGEETQPAKQITISIGVSSTRSTILLEELIVQADAALYESKRRNRNCVTFYS